MALILLASPVLEVEPEARTALLEAAAAAAPEARAPLLRAWASLGGRPQALPEGLLELGRSAIDWSQQAGPFVVFASRGEGRLRVGLRDPAEIVDRVEAYAWIGANRRQLDRRDDSPTGRFDFSLDPPPPDDATLIVEVSTTRLGRPLVLRRVVLEPSAPTSPPSAPEVSRATPEVEGAWAEASWPWWIIVGGMVAAGLTGAAVWQEVADR